MTEVFEDAQTAQMQKCEKCHFSVVILNSLKRQLEHVGTKAYVVLYLTHVCRYISGVRHAPRLLDNSPEHVFSYREMLKFLALTGAG